MNKQRWIYAASKQMLDRVIYAYGVRDNFDYTLFRPFNFIGPNLDNVDEPKEGSSRVFTQFLSNIMYRRPSCWWTVANKSVPSPSSMTPWSACCASSRTPTTSHRAAFTTSATRPTAPRSASWRN